MNSLVIPDSALASSILKPNCPHIACETIEGEVIIIQLKTGNYYSLENIAGEIWSLIEAGTTLSTIVTSVLDRCEGSHHEIEAAIEQFLGQLYSENLIAIEQDSLERKEPVPSEQNPVQNSDKSTFQAPVLTKYTDMQDLLLLDPIHEVEPSGWPKRSEEFAQ